MPAFPPRGYLDMSVGDFRELYQHAFRHALERLSECATAGQMMLPATWTVRPDMLLEEVVQGMATRELKGLPVVDEAQRVVGVLTETDLLRHFGVITFTHFLDRYLKDLDTSGHTLHQTTVAAIMQDLGFLFVLVPVGLGVLVLLTAAVLFNNIPRTRRYPEVWL